MKYGRIICDPRDADAVVGKKYIFSDRFNALNNNPDSYGSPLTLGEVFFTDCDGPFKPKEISGFRYSFIREVFED